MTPQPTLIPIDPQPSSTPSQSPSHGPSSSPSKLPSSSPTTSMPSTPPSQSPSLSPNIDPCGNNLCEPDLGESPDTCPSDCQRFSFKTKTNNNSNNAGGIMLTLKAAGDSTSATARTSSSEPMCVTSLDAFGKKDADGVQVRVYTKVGSYIGFEEDDSVWKIVYNRQITTEKSIATQLEFDQPVCIMTGDEHSFYIYSKKGLLFPRGNGNKQVPYDTDNKLMIMEGIATKKEFDQVTMDSYYNGEVRYFSSGSTSSAPRDTGVGKESPSTPTPTNSPSKSPSKPVAQPRGGGLVHFISNSVTNANSRGVMFTLSALQQDVHITSFDIRVKKDSDATKVGSYIGFEEDDSVWKIVYNRQITTEKSIATQLEFDQPVCIMTGDEHSFYIYSKKGLLFPRGNGNKQVPYDTDNKLMIMEGIATKKEFDQVTMDSYYNGEVRYFSSGSTSSAPRDTGVGKESPSTPTPTNSPSKSPSKPVAQPRGGGLVHFISNSVTNANSRGVMFTLSALQQDVHITSFDIRVKKDSDAQVMVYTRSGDYIGSEFSDEGWTLIFDASVQAVKGELTNIGQLNRDILITAGQQQSFYLYAKKGILYEEGNNQGDTFASDGVVAIQEGIALKKEFQQEVGVSKFSGGVLYY